MTASTLFLPQPVLRRRSSRSRTFATIDVLASSCSTGDFAAPTKPVVFSSIAATMSTSKSNDSSDNKTMRKKMKRVVIHQWVCDICKVETFADYETACSHEQSCSGVNAAEVTVLQGNAAEEQQESDNSKIHSYFGKAKVSNTTLAATALIKVEKCQRTPRRALSKGKPCNKKVECKAKRNRVIDAIPVSRDDGNFKIDETREKKTKGSVFGSRKSPRVTAGNFPSQGQKLVPPTAAKKGKLQSIVSLALPTKKKKASDTTALTSMFHSVKHHSDAKEQKELKELYLAEHVSAEFVSKRRAATALDRERQERRKKRLLVERKQPLNDNVANSLSSLQVNSDSSVLNLTNALKFSSQQVLLAPAPVAPTSAPKFPILSHVMGYEDETVYGSIISEAQHAVLRTTPRYQAGTLPRAEEDYTGILVENDYNIDMSTDELQCAFASVLSPSISCRDSLSNNEVFPPSFVSQLWRDKYTIQNVPHDVCGADNKAAADLLMNFINNWREHCQQVIHPGKAKQTMKGKENNKYCTDRAGNTLDDDFIWSDTDNDDDLCNLFLLTGPTGSGKTSLVHAAAKNSRCVILEINTTDKRGGQALNRLIGGSMQYHSSLTFLKGGNDELLESFKVEDRQEENTPLVLVLIDEVDIIFENDGDCGFWMALSNLAKKVKCPIILTATLVPQALIGSMQFQHASLTRPTPMECATKMCQISKMEKMMWRNDLTDGGVGIKNGLALISKLCNCDLRRIINELQLFNFSHLIPERHPNALPDNRLLASRTKCFVDNFFLKYPTISGILPKRVSSETNTVIKISGDHFQEALQIARSASGCNIGEVEVLFGEQLSPAVSIVNNSLILAVCPPSLFPSSIDLSDCFHNNFANCLTCRYAPVVVRVNGAAGLSLRSDSLLVNGAPYRGVVNIEYDFSDSDCRQPEIWSQTKHQNKLICGSNHKAVFDEQSLALDSPFYGDKEVNETDNVSVPNCDEAEKLGVLDFECHVNQLGLDATTNEACTKSVQSGSPVQLLERATSCLMLSLNTPHGNEYSAPSIITCSPILQGNNGDDMFDLAKSLELASDAAMFDDCFSGSKIPVLAGAVAGFGCDMIDDPAFLRVGGSRHPSFGKVFSNGLNDSSFYFGCSDTYMTFPANLRNRRLLARSLESARATNTCLSVGNAPPVGKYNAPDTFDGHSDVELGNGDVGSNLFASSTKSEEDLFLPCRMPLSLHVLPGTLRRAAAEICVEFLQLPAHQHFLIMEQKKALRKRNILDEVVSMFDDKAKMASNCFGCKCNVGGDLELVSSSLSVAAVDDNLDRRFALEYFPHLCAMAAFEVIRESVDDESMQSVLDVPNSRRSLRLSRRCRAVREHYFDKFCQSTCKVRGITGKHVGARLAEMKMSG